MSSQYYSNLLDTYRRRFNNDKGMFHVRKAVYETNRIEEFRNREKIKQEMARQKRLQIESDKRLKYRMQKIREQERAIANRYAHIKNPTSQRYGKTERNRFGDQSDKMRDVQKHQFTQYNKPRVGKMLGKIEASKITYLPSLNISKVTSKSSSTNMGKSSNYQGKASLRGVSEKEGFDINLRFTRNVIQEMQTTDLNSKSFDESNSYYNPSVISHNHNERCGNLNKGDEYIDYNSISNATGQNYLVQASLEDPRWYQHIFVKATSNGPMYIASHNYYYHPGGEQLEPVYLVNNGQLPKVNADFQHLPGHSSYEQKSLGVDNIQPNAVHHHLQYQNYPESEYIGDWNTSQNLESEYYSEALTKKKYEMLVLNQDDKRAVQIRVKQASTRSPFNTYDILSIEHAQGKSRTPSAR